MTSDERLSQLKEIAMELLDRYEDQRLLAVDNINPLLPTNQRQMYERQMINAVNTEITDYRNRIAQLTEE